MNPPTKADDHSGCATYLRDWETATGGAPDDLIAAALAVIKPLKAERDDLKAQLDRVRELHRGVRIYDDCGHKHEVPDTVLGVQLVPDVGLVCADGYLYTICAECCRDGDYHSERCAADHPKGLCYPCPTIAALDGGEQ